MAILNWFLWFVIYSFIGWFYESVLCSVREKRLINRGFLNGPVCPVYGFGALTVLFVLGGRTDDILLLFIVSAVLTCTLEYLTAFLLEKLFHAKWWDYSNRRFNINGRVSLAGALVFGAMSVLLIKFIHPLISDIAGRLSGSGLIAVSTVLFMVLALDTILTVRHILLLNGRLSEIQRAINVFVEEHAKRAEELHTVLLERFEQSEFYSERVMSLLNLNRFQSFRLVRAFPKLRSVKYEDAMKKLKETLIHLREKSG